MNNSDIKKEIKLIVEEISERASTINQNLPDQHLALDIDLLMEDLRLLYRKLQLLKQTLEEPVSEEPISEEPVSTEPVSEEPVSTEPVSEEPVSEEPVSTEPVSEEPISEEPVSTEPVSEEPISEEPVSTEPVSEEPEPDHEPESEPESELQPPPEPQTAPQPQSQSQRKAVNDLLAPYTQKTIGEHYIEADNSLHQRISGEKEDKSIGARMQQQPIRSIKEVIGVNEKFLFINELFNGDIEVYHEVIAVLNEKGSMQAAFDYLNELAGKYSWDAQRSASTIERLANFVQRRYMR